jgi:hypothetical protein
MKRREFVEKIGIGATVLAPIPAFAGTQEAVPSEHAAHTQVFPPVEGLFANATVTFGEWTTDPPLDRFPNASPGGPNIHLILPRQANIMAGGSVNFVIAGLHQVVVYGPGTLPANINTALTTPTTGTPAGVALINDPTNRVYRGPDPSLMPRDRVEAVYFPKPGLYLVICGVLGHFNGGMFGFVNVTTATPL